MDQRIDEAEHEGRQQQQKIDQAAAVARGVRAADVLGRALANDRHVPGFGQPLYPDGDPRVPVLSGIAREFGATTEADALLKVAAAQGLPPPNVDFGLATLTRALRLSSGAGEAIFIAGRLAGWLAHAMEEYAERSDLRMRALYVGLRPKESEK